MLQGEIVNIAQNAFEGVKDKITLVLYLNTYVHKYAIDNKIPYITVEEKNKMDNAQFKFDRDNYNITNSGLYFSSYSIGDFKNMLESNKLKQKATDQEKEPFLGACSGMIVTAALFKEDYLTPSYWDKNPEESKIENTYDIQSTIEGNNRLEWLINFYQIFQDEIFADMRQVIRSRANMLEGVYNRINQYYDNSTNYYDQLYIGWNAGGVGYHASLILERPQELTEQFFDEYGDTFKGYKYRIRIYDPNYLEDKYIYMNEALNKAVEGTNDTIISELPANTKVSVFCINEDKIFNLEKQIKEGGKIKFSSEETDTADIKLDNSKATITNEEGEYAKISDGDIIEGSLQCEVNPVIGVTTEGDSDGSNYIKLGNNDIYSVENEDEIEGLDVSMEFKDSYMTAETKAGGKAVFENNKSVELSNASGEEYELKLTLNEEFVTLPWYTVSLEGTDAKEIKLEMVEQGAIVSGDNLTNLKVKGNNLEETVELNINTDENEILVTADEDQTELIAFIDTDGDGTFETPIGAVKGEEPEGESPEGEESGKDR